MASGPGTGVSTGSSKGAVESEPVRGKGGVLRRFLVRWRRMSGMTPEDAADPNSTPPRPHRLASLSYRLAGVRRWSQRKALLHNGFLILYAGDKGTAIPDDPAAPSAPKPELRLNLGMSVIEFEKTAQKVDVELGSGVTHHLAFPNTSKADFDAWLLSVYFHRVYAQKDFLRGSGTRPLGAGGPPSASSRPQMAAINAAIIEISAQFRKAKHSFLKLRGTKQGKSKSSRSWRFFRSRKKEKETPDPDELQSLLESFESLLTGMERIKSQLETEANRLETAAPVKAPAPILVKTVSDEALPQVKGTTPEPTPPPTASSTPVASASNIALGLTTPTTSLAEPGDTTLDFNSEKEVESEDEDEETTPPMELPIPVAPPPPSQVVAPPAPQLPTAPPETPKPVPITGDKSVKEPTKKEETKTVAKPSIITRERRRILPAKMQPTLSITAGVVMRALAENSLPLRLFEPVGSLQRMAEQVEYTELLDKAAKEKDPVVRMGLCLGFAVAGLAHTHHRTGKPFNPLLGETFAMDRWEDLGWRFHSEQISHSPDISACCLEGRQGWLLNGVLKIGRPKLSFSYVSILPTGLFEIKLFKANETYRYQPMECRVTNPISTTKRRLHNVGSLGMSCSNGLVGSVRMESGTVECTGSVMRGKTSLATLEGRWSEAMSMRVGSSGPSIPLFAVRPPLGDEASYYNFGLFARQLNELPTAEEKKTLPPTDSRFRPDQRAYENGQLEEAQRMKVALEEAQRKRKRAAASAPIRWFSLPNSNDYCSATSNRLYWTAAATSFRSAQFIPIFDV